MRFFLVSLALTACGGETRQPDGGDADPPPALSDEFGDPASLADWTERDPAQGTAGIEDELLVLTSTGGAWVENMEAFLLHRPIEGDFVIRAQVRAAQAADASLPSLHRFNAVGLMARDPAGDRGMPESWVLQTIGFQISTFGSRAGLTVAASTGHTYRTTTDTIAELIICRIGSVFRTYFAEAGDAFTETAVHDVPELPRELQVGFALDAQGVQPYLRGEIDWVRFAVPLEERDCTAEIPGEP